MNDATIEYKRLVRRNLDTNLDKIICLQFIVSMVEGKTSRVALK